MTERSLIPPESLALVGQAAGPPVTVELTMVAAQRYAQAVGDENPIYFDTAAAQAAGYRTLVVPPTFLPWAMVQGRPLTELREDGLFRGGESPLRLNVQRTMFGGEEFDFVQPVCVGDRVTATTRLAALEEKQGSKGPFVRITRETTFTDDNGNVVARSRQIGIAR